MKVVLFCGGLGTRLREHSETVPKPLVNIGNRPIIWHLMRYYAHYGHKDFILCLGHRGDLIREFFLDYRGAMSTDFVLRGDGSVQLLAPDAEDWTITFVDTGLHSNLGMRLLRVRSLLEGEEAFLANYSDGLSDLPLDEHVGRFQRSGSVAHFMAARPAHSFHSVAADDEGWVSDVSPVQNLNLWINSGFFCLRREIFDYIEPGEELVEQPFARLIGERKLTTWKYDGFWQPMDTFKDKIAFDRMEAREQCPWKVWNPRRGTGC